MLTITEVLVRVKNNWINLPTNTPLSTLINYNRVFITILDSVSNLLNQYDLFSFYNFNLVNLTQTVEHFIENYNRTIPTPITPILSLSNKKKVKYYTIWDYGLNADRLNLSNSVLTYNGNNTPDLKITPSDVFKNTIASLQSKVLFVVNGVILREYFNDGFISIPNAGVHLDHNTDQTLSILDFSQLGGFTRLDITPNNVTVFKEADDYVTLNISFDSPLQSNVTLVSNGKLHLFYDIYKVIDTNKISVSLRYSDIVKEAFETDSSLVNWISRISPNSSGFDLKTFDPIKYITKDNSFVLCFNTSPLSEEIIHTVTTGLPTTYFTPSVTSDVLFLSDGSIGYYVVNEITAHNKTVLSVSNPNTYKLLMDSTHISSNSVANNATLNNAIDSDQIKLKQIYAL